MRFSLMRASSAVKRQSMVAFRLDEYQASSGILL
jgi:hypothetical protein